ncbi:MAG: BTAD domain-containing putative transcriptional regulator [Desertimonas sp.]
MTPRAHVEVPRRTLAALLAPERLHRVTTIVAGAGWGKSTLIRQARDERWIVHQLDASDDVLATLIGRLDRYLRAAVPVLSDEVARFAEQSFGVGVGTTDHAVALASSLADELEDLTERPLVIAFDDLHRLTPGGASCAFIEALCRYGPAAARVVVTSQTALAFPLARLRVSGDLLELRADDLAFGVDEIGMLLRAHGADPTRAPAVLEQTAGWAVAVAALCDGAAGEQDGGLVGDIVEAVLGDVPDAVVDVVESLALLPWWTPEMAAVLIPGRDEALAAAGPVIVDTDRAPGARTVLEMIRDHVRPAEGALNPGHRRLLRTAMALFADRQAWSEAIECAAGGGDCDATIELLREHGHQMTRTGHLAGVTRLAATVEHHPELSLLMAELALLSGDLIGAAKRFDALLPASGPIPVALAWRAGFGRHLDGDVDGAIELYARADARAATAADLASMLGWWAGAHFFRHEYERARLLALQGRQMAEAAQDDRALATAHTVLGMLAVTTGDDDAAGRDFDVALECATRCADVLQLTRIRQARSVRWGQRGDLDAALAEICEGIRLVDMTGFVRWRAIGLCQRAVILLLRGRLDEAIADLNLARRIVGEVAPPLLAHPLTHLGQAYALRGNTALALAAFRDAVASAEGQRDRQILAVALAGRARLMAADDVPEAKLLVERALRVDSKATRGVVLLASAHVAVAAGDVAGARLWVEAAAEAAAAFQDLPTLGEIDELRGQLSDDPTEAERWWKSAEDTWRHMGARIGLARVALARGMATGGIAGLARCRAAAEEFERLGVRRLALAGHRAADDRNAPGRAAIKTFGGLELVVDGLAVDGSVWHSRVAREVLGMLLASRGRSVRRLTLIDHFWPDDDSPQASNRLSAALSTIRRVLDPTRTKPADHHVVADRDTVALAHVDVDVDEFVHLAEAGLELYDSDRHDAGLVLLRRAESMYVGDFLEDFQGSDWAVTQREQWRAMYLAVATRVAEASVAEGDAVRANGVYLRMLERDEFDEVAHLGVVRSLLDQGHAATARRMYGQYVARMADLDIEPAPFPR